MEAVIKNIEQRLYETYNINIRGIPQEITGRKSILNISGKKYFEIKEENPAKELPCASLIGKDAYVKSELQNKLEDKYTGPFEITDQRKKGSGLSLKGLKNGFTLEGLKLWRGGRMLN